MWKILGYIINYLPIILFTIGTDGIDGMTDVAGSIAYNYEQTDYDDSQRHLDCFDSFNYHKNKMDLVIKPGHTGTNVMDIHTLIIEED